MSPLVETLFKAIRPDLTAYFAKVDVMLADKTPAERQRMLVDEIKRWQHRYGEFCAKVDNGLPTSPGVTAFDFIDTIAGLDQRLTPTAQACADVRAWQQRRRAGA
jgi:hypothetical protein